jgi:hypothetical protein
MTRLDRGVHVAPFVTLAGRPVLLCIATGGVLLARVDVTDDVSEARLAAELERLLAIYETPNG